MATELAVFVLALVLATGSALMCSPSQPPDHQWLVCEILSEADDCELFPVSTGGYYQFHACGTSQACTASAGMRLEVRCPDDGETRELVKDGQVLDGDNVSWSFATAALAEGEYQCRWPNGSVYGNRSVKIDDKVYLVPKADRKSLFHQTCKTNIVPGYNCSVPQASSFFGLSPANQNDPQHLCFNVLGSRPVELAVQVLWDSHYPVDLHLAWSSMASASDSLHSVEFSLRDLQFVGEEDSVQIYVAITANSSSSSASTCLSVGLQGDPILFPNVSLPEDQTVREGELAQFFCHVSSTEEEVILQFSPFLSVAFLLHSPSSGTLTLCFSCSFSRFEIGECRVTGEPACAGLQFSNTSSGVAGVRSHQLAAQWGQVGINHSGSEVVCALAVSAVTQWTQTATLTVLPASPSPQPSDEREAGLLALASLVAVGVVAVGVCAGVLVCWCKRHGRKNASQTLREQVPLGTVSLSSSASSTPTPVLMRKFHHDEVPVIKVSCLPAGAGAEKTGHIGSVELLGDRRSVDSGLDFKSSAEEIHSAKASYDGYKSSHIPSSGPREEEEDEAREVCVYVSYSDSQADWVRSTLLPLLLSFQPITVTDHEGHMIAGNVISEERLRLLRSADKVVAVVSPDYHRVKWCCYELQHAIQLQPAQAEGRLLPILCGGCSELPSTISTLHPISLLDPAWAHKLQVAVRTRRHLLHNPPQNQ